MYEELVKTYRTCGQRQNSGTSEIRWVNECRLTCKDRGKWLQGVKRTFQSARLHCTRQELEQPILRDETYDYILQKCNQHKNPAELYWLIFILPLCGLWFQWKHSSGGRLLSRRHRHVFDCSCGWPWQSLHTPTGTSTITVRTSMNHVSCDLKDVPYIIAAQKSCPRWFVGQEGTYIFIFACQFAHFHSVPGSRPMNLQADK